MDKQTLKLGACVLENLPKMSSSEVQRWIDNPSGLKRFLSGLVSAKICISDLTSVMILANEINPHDFFKTREGLWVSDGFCSCILSRASKKKVSEGGVTIGHADLTEAAHDEELVDELPEGHVFENVDTFLVHFATLIESQWGGKKGALLTAECTNIFYVKVGGEVFAVNMHWSDDQQKWLVFENELNDIMWCMTSRAFSATAA